MTTFLNRLRVWASEYEPARITAALAALATFAGLFGYGQLVADLAPGVNAIAGGIASLVVVLSGERTRTKVWSPATVEAMLAHGDPDAAASVSESFDDVLEDEPEILGDDVEHEAGDSADLADYPLEDDVEPGQHRAED